MKTVLSLSGKGGVGKTIVATNLALKLNELGNRVGVVDCDLSNPNLPKMLGIHQPLEITEDAKLKPVPYNNMQVYSMAFVAEDKPIAMIGSEYSEIIRDVIQHGMWDVDYMVVDMSAGLYDPFKEIISVFANSLVGSVIVAQPAHLEEAERVIRAHIINDIPIVGLIENFSTFKCECQREYDFFGPSGIDNLGKKYNVDVLGKIPLSIEIRKGVESHNPLIKGPGEEAINNAVDKIMKLEPRTPGFLTEVIEKAKKITRDLVIKIVRDMIIISNKEIPIKELQMKYGFPGGKIIRLDIMDDDMVRVIERCDFTVKDGMLKNVISKEGTRLIPDYQIDLKARALGWALMGRKKLSSGSEIEYDLMDAWLNNDARVFGSQGTIKAVKFLREVWSELRARSERFEGLIKLLV